MSAEINASQLKETATGYKFEVRVAENNSETLHTVTLSNDDYERLARGRDPRIFVEDSFKFLLERESKEAILREFDISVIGKYFPEYEDVI